MSDEQTIARLTRQEVEQYHNLKKELRQSSIRNALAYPLFMGFEISYLQSCVENISTNQNYASADTIMTGIAGALLFSTALNFALGIIDQRRAITEIKTLEQKITK